LYGIQQRKDTAGLYGIQWQLKLHLM